MKMGQSILKALIWWCNIRAITGREKETTEGMRICVRLIGTKRRGFDE